MDRFLIKPTVGLYKHTHSNYFRKTLDAGDTLKVTQKLTAKYKGTRELIGTFNSEQLHDITGSVTIEVQPDKEEEEA